MLKFLKILLSLLSFGLYRYKEEKKPHTLPEFQPRNNLIWSSEEDKVLLFINMFRAEHDLDPIEKEDSHYVVAGARTSYFARRAEPMDDHEGFGTAHTLLRSLGIASMGECLAYKFGTEEGVVNAWIRSKGTIDPETGKYKIGHRDILLGDYEFGGVSKLIEEDYPDISYYCLTVGKR